VGRGDGDIQMRGGRSTGDPTIELAAEDEQSSVIAPSLRGRGVSAAPAGRFELLQIEADPDGLDPDDQASLSAPRGPRTQYLRDASRSVISRNDSPDVPFEISLNPYRGCEHGCSYCYARPSHEYLGLSAGLDFEAKILVKEDAPELLAEELRRKSFRPQVIALSGVTDAYQPIERRLRITRRCLEILAEARNPVGIITKSALVARDIDVLGELARHRAVSVTLSVTTLDPDLARRMEPRAAQPNARLGAVRALAAAGIPVGVNVAPIVPGLTDHEIPAILAAAREAGAQWAGHIVLRLPYGVADLFDGWLAQHFPERRAKVLSRVREVRGGELNDPRFGSRMRGTGLYAEQIHRLFDVARDRAGLSTRGPKLSADGFRRPGGRQLLLL
jgi:DNA repair photolyase